MTTTKGLLGVDHLEVLQINPVQGRSHRSMVREMLKVLRITLCEDLEEECSEVMQVMVEETWLTPYKWYLADGMLSPEPAENFQEKLKKVYPDRWGLISLWLSSPTPRLCQRRPMHPNNVQAS